MPSAAPARDRHEPHQGVRGRAPRGHLLVPDVRAPRRDAGRRARARERRRRGEDLEPRAGAGRRDEPSPGTAGSGPPAPSRAATRSGSRRPAATARPCAAPASRSDGRDAFDLYDNMFPVRGRHDFGGRNARLRLGPRRPQPPGPGRVRPLRHPARGRARRPGQVQAVPLGRRPLPRDRRRGHERGLRLHAPGGALALLPRRPRLHRASASARSATPATPAAATCTSSSGAGPAGTTAASPSTRCRRCAPGTPGPRRRRLLELVALAVREQAVDAVVDRQEQHRRATAMRKLPKSKSFEVGDVEPLGGHEAADERAHDAEHDREHDAHALAPRLQQPGEQAHEEAPQRPR